MANKVIPILIELEKKVGLPSLFDLAFTVVDKVTKSPIQGVLITLYSNSQMIDDFVITNAVTDAEGKVTIGNMPIGTYYWKTWHGEYNEAKGNIVAE